MQLANSGQRWAGMVEVENCSRRVVQIVCWLDTCMSPLPLPPSQTSLLSQLLALSCSELLFNLYLAA